MNEGEIDYSKDRSRLLRKMILKAVDCCVIAQNAYCVYRCIPHCPSQVLELSNLVLEGNIYLNPSQVKEVNAFPVSFVSSLNLSLASHPG